MLLLFLTLWIGFTPPRRDATGHRSAERPGPRDSASPAPSRQLRFPLFLLLPRPPQMQAPAKKRNSPKAAVAGLKTAFKGIKALLSPRPTSRPLDLSPPASSTSTSATTLQDRAADPHTLLYACVIALLARAHLVGA